MYALGRMILPLTVTPTVFNQPTDDLSPRGLLFDWCGWHPEVEVELALNPMVCANSAHWLRAILNMFIYIIYICLYTDIDHLMRRGV